MTDIESEARGISQRHHTISVHQPGDYCRCGYPSPCPDRLAADAITQAAEKAAEHLRELIEDADGEYPAARKYLKADAVAALAILTGQDHE